MENKSRKRKRNKKDRREYQRIAGIKKWANSVRGLDYMDRNLLPGEGQWGVVKSPITGIEYRVKIARIERVYRV